MSSIFVPVVSVKSASDQGINILSEQIVLLRETESDHLSHKTSHFSELSFTVGWHFLIKNFRSFSAAHARLLSGCVSVKRGPGLIRFTPDRLVARFEGRFAFLSAQRGLSVKSGQGCRFLLARRYTRADKIVKLPNPPLLSSCIFHFLPQAGLAGRLRTSLLWLRSSIETSYSWTKRKRKLAAYAMNRVAAGAHLPTHSLFEPAKRPDDRVDYCLDCSFYAPWANSGDGSIASDGRTPKMIFHDGSTLEHWFNESSTNEWHKKSEILFLIGLGLQ